jgi:hypothetical protein
MTNSQMKATKVDLLVLVTEHCLLEERRFLGYKIPVRTSQETHYVSATESSLLMMCKI